MPNKTRSTDTGLPFIVSVNQVKVDPATRRLIRSHVMRGKNRAKKPGRRQGSRDNNVPKTYSSTTHEVLRAETIPRWLSSKFSGIRFADEVEPALVEDVFTLLSISSKAMFLLDQCIIPSEDGLVQAWIAPLIIDPAYLHIACLATQAFFDSFFGRIRTAQARRAEYASFAKTVKILQERVTTNDRNELLSDSTIMTVLALSGYAYTQGDHMAAHQHNVALLKLVCIKGAHTMLRNPNKKLVNEIIRTDFCICYESGEKPVLFTFDGIPWPLMLPWERAVSDKDPEGLVTRLHPELAAVLTAMSHFCRLINIASTNEAARVTEDTFLHVMGSVLYRLLHLRYDRGTLDEAIRLGLLAFSRPIFLDWKTVEWINGYFVTAWRQTLEDLIENLAFTPRDSIWLLMTGALSMSHDPSFLDRLTGGLRVFTDLCHITTWEDMEGLLNSYIWIGVSLDQPGKEIFGLTSKRAGKTPPFTR
ncbi:hypothetical protein BU23DRAFT_518851 [Bimuria novae-zelandiae CBS 107.79]|uniref:Transcription factor domain-containing protein n=1 Tax=Bimuria novae-zelandiae CBS 107.79 TaxID=1447943 RepID=A0A6A5USF6_9PLEO|nr:hypothetical protein BU23DRAFT_518851 [Bimuria novae-zelandiae CBS 107.79]